MGLGLGEGWVVCLHYLNVNHIHRCMYNSTTQGILLNIDILFPNFGQSFPEFKKRIKISSCK